MLSVGGTAIMIDWYTVECALYVGASVSNVPTIHDENLAGMSVMS